MLKRQTTGSVVCTSCGKLVGVNDPTCWNCGRRNPGLWGFAPLVRQLGQDLGFVQLVIWGCAALYVATLIADLNGIGTGGLSFLAPSGPSLFLFGAAGSLPVFNYGRWWTLLSAGWLHGGLLHILFNMMWVRQLAPATAELYGAGRTVLIYTVASVTGFLFSSFAGAYPVIPFFPGAPLTIGASAAIFGLLGALVYYGRRTGSNLVGRTALGYAAVLFIFGLLMQGVDNWAHLGGFLGGFGMARWLDPMRPERLDHLVAALVCLAMTALSILLSIVHGLGLNG